MFTRNLSVLITSGLPISRAVKNIATQTKNKKFRKILEAVFEDLQSGRTFADGLAKYPAIFDEICIKMTKVGEMSGNLEEILSLLAVQLEKEHELTSKLKGALTYPAVIVVAMIAIGILMLTFILPKMMSVFKDMNVALPASTQFMIKLSDLLRNHAILFFTGLVFVGIFLKFFLLLRPEKNVGFCANQYSRYQ
jgi:Type II secretory pathway, component PulF